MPKKDEMKVSLVNPEFRNLTITSSLNNSPMVILDSNDHLPLLESHVFKTYHNNVFLTNRDGIGGLLTSVLVRDGYLAYNPDSNPIREGFKLVSAYGILNNQNYYGYIKRAVRNTIRNLLANDEKIGFIVGKDFDKFVELRANLENLIRH